MEVVVVVPGGQRGQDDPTRYEEYGKNLRSVVSVFFWEYGTSAKRPKNMQQETSQSVLVNNPSRTTGRRRRESTESSSPGHDACW